MVDYEIRIIQVQKRFKTIDLSVAKILTFWI